MSDAKFLGAYRQLAQEFRDLRRQVDRLRTSVDQLSTADTPEARAEAMQIKAAVDAYAVTNYVDINELLSLLRTEVNANDAVRDYWGDTFTALGNEWDVVKDRLDRLGALAAEELPSSAALSELADLLDDAVKASCLVTIPARLNQHLANYRNGQVLKFDTSFADELIRPDDVTAVLNYLYNQPLAVSGIVDPDRRIITKVSANVGRRALTFLILAVLIGFFITLGFWVRDVSGMSSWFKSTGTVSDNAFVGGMIVVFLGGVAHLLVGAVKQVRKASAEDESRRFVSVGNWVVWAVAHEVDLVVSVVILGVLGAYMVGGRGETDTVTLLAVGYSADSLVDVMLPKFEELVAKRTEVVRATVLGGAG